MEIERKFTVRTLPVNLSSYPCRIIEQAYLNTDPVVRIRREDNSYYLTYKGKGLRQRGVQSPPKRSVLLSPAGEGRRKYHFQKTVCHSHRASAV